MTDYPSTALCIITKNSAEVIEDTLEQTLEWYVSHGIDIYFYDASDVDATEKVVKKYIDRGYTNLFHLKFPPDSAGMYRMHRIVNGMDFKKEYDYIWPSKNGSFVDYGCLDRLIEAEKQEFDLVVIDIFGNKEQAGIGAQISPTEFYYNRGILAMSWDTMVLRFETMGRGELWKDGYTEMEHQVQFGLFEHVFKRLLEVRDVRILALYDAVIYHSRLRVSGFFKPAGLKVYLDIWKDMWIEANMSLPSAYDAYKRDVIHDANVPWVLGDPKILKKVHEAGGLTPENLDHTLENWEWVSDIPKEEIKKIAYGEYEGSPERKEKPKHISSILKDAGVKISVIVPCYNVQDRIVDCLESLVRQSVGFDSLELILVDDASMDWTVNTLKEYEGKYPDNIAVVLCEENGRQGTARNIGMQYASGDYISFVDADDVIHSQMYEVLGKIALETDAELVTFLYTTDEGKLDVDYAEQELAYDLIRIDTEEDRREFVLRNDLINNSCTQKLYKRELLERCNSWYAEGVSYEEPLFTYPLRYELETVAITGLPLYHYHLNPNGTINQTLSNPNTIRDHLSVQAQLLTYMRTKPYYSCFKEEIELNFIHCFAYEPKVFLEKRGYELPDSIRSYIGQVMNRDVPDWRENPYLEQIPEEEREYLLQMGEKSI